MTSPKYLFQDTRVPRACCQLPLPASAFMLPLTRCVTQVSDRADKVLGPGHRTVPEHRLASPRHGAEYPQLLQPCDLG